MTDDNSRRVGDSSNGNRHQESASSVERMQSDKHTPDEATNTLGVGMFQVKLILLSGFVWMARGFEIVLMRSITALQSCSWGLQRWQGSLMYTLTLLFNILGCFLYGIWSDNYGRRTALSSSLIFVFVFGAVSAGLPSYTWFVVFRSVVGFAIGGLPQTLVLCCEYMPGSQRGRAIYILSCFWALGVVVMLSILFYVLGHFDNWRIFVAIGALPAFLAMVMMRFFPESFRFLLVSDQYIAANEIVAEVAESNQKELLGLLHVVPTQERRGKVSDLLGHPYTWLTLLFWFMGLTSSISFLGLNMITPAVLHDKQTPFLVNASEVDFLGNISSSIPCTKEMSTDDFILTIWTSALDFPGFVIYVILVDIIDRKKLLCASYLVSSLFIFLLLIPSKNFAMYAAFMFGARTLMVSQFDLLLLMVAEVYPTTHRGTAVGLEAVSFYLGQFLSSYIADSLLRVSLKASVVFYGVLVFACAASSICLKEETKGKDLKDILME